LPAQTLNSSRGVAGTNFKLQESGWTFNEKLAKLPFGTMAASSAQIVLVLKNAEIFKIIFFVLENPNF
jgi:hypothetical protein